MHVLYVHQNFPAQFGHIAMRLMRQYGFQCTFVTERDDVPTGGIERIVYRPRGGATPHTHFASRGVENFTWKSHAVLQALQDRPDIRPDVIVGHSGFGSTLFLPEFYNCPVINFSEWFYRWDGSESDFRASSNRVQNTIRLSNRCRDAALLADLDGLYARVQPDPLAAEPVPARIPA